MPFPAGRGPFPSLPATADAVPDAVADADAGAEPLRGAAGTANPAHDSARRVARLVGWVRLRCGIEPRTLAALTVVLVVAAGLAVQHFWSARPRTVTAPATAGQARGLPEDGGDVLPDAADEGSSDEGSSGEGSPEGREEADGEPLPSPGAPAGAAAGGRIVVDVGGKVRHPGVLRLPAGSRVEDALAAAGGTRDGTDLTGLNRARVLVDGEQVVVGGPAPQPVAPAGAGSGATAAGPAGPVGLNSATLEQLDSLPGVGPVLAQHILDYRTRNGGFSSVDQLREVNGIGDRRFADLRPLVRP